MILSTYVPKFRPSLASLSSLGAGQTTTTQDVQSLITQTAIQYGVSPQLAIAVARRESGFNQGARGAAGEIGVFQLMPATAAGLGVDPYDLRQNIRGGVLYLSQMLNRYGGDTQMALAAYNAGPGNVDRGTVPSSSWEYSDAIMRDALMNTESAGLVYGPSVPPNGGLLTQSASIPPVPLDTSGWTAVPDYGSDSGNPGTTSPGLPLNQTSPQVSPLTVLGVAAGVGLLLYAMV